MVPPSPSVACFKASSKEIVSASVKRYLSEDSGSEVRPQVRCWYESDSLLVVSDANGA